jgi:hypothetical protein
LPRAAERQPSAKTAIKSHPRFGQCRRQWSTNRTSDGQALNRRMRSSPARSFAARCAAASREKPLFSWQHLADIVALDRPAAGKPTQHPHAYLLGDGGDGLRCHVSGGPKAHGLRDIIGILDRFEHPVDDAAMVMDVPVEGSTEAVDKAHRPEAGMRAGTAALAQMGLDDAQQDMQHGAARPRPGVVASGSRSAAPRGGALLGSGPGCDCYACNRLLPNRPCSRTHHW